MDQTVTPSEEGTSDVLLPPSQGQFAVYDGVQIRVYASGALLHGGSTAALVASPVVRTTLLRVRLAMPA